MWLKVIVVALFFMGLTVQRLAFAAEGHFPRRGALVLDFNIAPTFAGTEDISDIYGPNVSIERGDVAVGDVALGLSYTLTEQFQFGFLFGGLTKIYEIRSADGSIDTWDTYLGELAIRARYLAPLIRKTNFTVDVGLGSYKLSDAKFTNSAVPGSLALTGRATGGFIDLGVERIWSFFAMGLSLGYRYTEIRSGYKAYMPGGLGVGNNPILEQRFVTLTGEEAHFDYSGFRFNLALRFYIGGKRSS